MRAHLLGAGDPTGDLSPMAQAEITLAIQEDERMDTFLGNLAVRLPNSKLPERFAKSDGNGHQQWTYKGVCRFIHETLHAQTVRHAYVGTKVLLASFDLNFSAGPAVCADGRLPPEEDFRAFVVFVHQTAVANLPTMMRTDGQLTPDSVVETLREYLDADKAKALEKAFRCMADKEKDGLYLLQKEFENDPSEFISNTMRVMPDELRIMAGY